VADPGGGFRVRTDGLRRSAAWFGGEGAAGMMYRSWLRGAGYGDDAFDGRPVIGIATTWSELSPCDVHLHDLAEYVKRGVWQAGGVPFEFPLMALGEPLLRPTAMLYRNLLAMQAEEMFRANPLDGVVLLCGCDKTTPALLMAAASVDLPTIMVTGGPMLNGKFRGADVGSGTLVWSFDDQLRAGTITNRDCFAAEACMSRSHGHCMTMGTASTMACVTEVMGMQPPYGATWPAVDARRQVLAQEAGRRAVAMVSEGLRPSQILTSESFRNAIVLNAAIGGSTNAIVHLLALAGRLGVPLELADFDRLAADVPLLVDLVPSGRHLMEDFCYAGGVPAVLRELTDLLELDCPTVTGKSLGENIAEAECFNTDVIRPRDSPVSPAGSSTAVLRGNLCPDGAVIKQSAASPHLLTHRGPAMVFDSPEEYYRVAAAEHFAGDATTVLVIRNCGPRGYPGMPEVANVALPTELLRAGVTDMVRICDGRMSGTAYGTVVLHVAPEAAAGGPLALVRNGDLIELDVPGRRLTLLVDDEELGRRRVGWSPPSADRPDRGWTDLYRRTVLQADKGADLDFLVGHSGHQVPRDIH
jgi:dihydroxy-acid dehydratase